MAQKLTLELVTPAKQVLSEAVDEITAPGAMGQFGVLPGHTPMLTTLDVGELSYRKGNETFFVAVNWGYVEIEEDRVTILVETAEIEDEIDLERAKNALGRAEAALAEMSAEEKEYLIMQQALARAMARIQVASRRGR
jgi:F-type H+-transporting ATPase subunit epsilon